MAHISIVTVTLNNLQGLKDTWASIPVGESYIEWIVIDGCSTDGTVEFLQRLERKPDIFISEPDNGIFHAMNKALALASGEIIIFLNAGDFFVSTMVPKKILNSYLENGWLWAVGKAITVDQDKNKLWEWPELKPQSLKLKLAVNSYCHQATVYQRLPLKDIGGFFEDSIYSDWSTSLQFLKIRSPHLENDYWTFFLDGGVSSQMSIDFWFNEILRLRRKSRSIVLKNQLIDYILQKLVYLFLLSKRGRQMRSDLVKKIE